MVERLDWFRRLPVDALPWWRRVASDFKSQIAVRTILGRCALLGARDYADITPELLEKLVSEYQKDKNLKYGLRLFASTDFCPSETRTALKKDYQIKLNKIRKIPWDYIISNLPYEQRKLALFLSDCWRKKHGQTLRRHRATKLGILLALRSSAATELEQLRNSQTIENIKNYLLNETDLEPQDAQNAYDEFSEALKLAKKYNTSTDRVDQQEDLLFLKWRAVVEKNEQFKALAQSAQENVIRWGRRVIPPKAKRWDEITQVRIAELVREIRCATTSDSRIRALDSALRRALFLMPIPPGIDLTKFWEIRSQRSFCDKTKDSEFCGIFSGAILENGELDPRYYKEEQIMDFSQTSNENNHVDDGLANGCHKSQKALILEQAAWAAEYPGRFRLRNNECYTTEQDLAIASAIKTSHTPSAYLRDVARCAFSRLLLVLEECEPPEEKEERENFYKKIAAIVDDAVCDSAREIKQSAHSRAKIKNDVSRGTEKNDA